MANDNRNNNVSLHIVQWNARSLMPKRNEFELLIAQEKAHIALVTETWLEPDTHFNVSGYNTLRRDRPDGYGGLAILIHKSIKVQQCSTYINNPGIEIMSVNLVNCNEIKNIVLVYCPSSVRTCLSDWEQIFSLFSSKCIIAGDFNGHHATWSSKTDARGIQLYDTALDSGFISLNDGSMTRVALVDGVAQNTSPDVTFVSTDLSVLLGWRIINENLGSDHLFIKISYKYNSSLNPVVTIKKRNFKLAKWSNYSEALENSLIQTVVPRNVQSLYDNFIEQLNKAADENIPFIKLNSNPSNGFRPKSYWNPNLSRLVAQRRLALKIFRRNPTPNNLSVLEHKTEVAKKAISQEKSKDWRNYCSSVNEQTSSSEMWKRMGWIKGRVSPRLSVSNEHKVELLCSLAPDYVYPKQQQFNSNNAVLEDKFTLQEMINCFKRKDTAPGTDGITYSLIFYLSSVSRQYLLELYNLIFSTGIIPKQWREIIVTPIPKSTPNNNNIKLRPISLISCLCKIFHSMLTKRLEWYIEKNMLLSKYTSGFRRGQSCQDCLVKLVSQIYTGFSHKTPTVACFVDITNAYNNVLIDVLVKTLDDIGIGKTICQYLWNFLSERHLMIKDETDVSKFFIRCTDRGLAQGDPISPILFNIVTIKCFHEIQNINMCQYADDFVLYQTSKNLKHVQRTLQKALDKFCYVLDELGLELSATKSKVCIFNRGFRSPKVELNINNHNLEKVDSYKYLGVWLDRSLRWSKHIGTTVEKVQRNLNLLKVLAGRSWGLHPQHLRHIYIALIRSRIDYSSYLYDTSAKCHLEKLNKLQNQALRIIGGFIKSTPIHVMESELCVVPLYIRRKYLAYKFCLKAKSVENNITNSLLDELYNLRQNSYWRNKVIPLLASSFNEVKEIEVASSYPLFMFTLRTWVTNINVNEIIACDLESVKSPKGSYDCNVLKYEVTKELCSKYYGWFTIFTDGSKGVEGRGAAYYIPSVDVDSLNNNFFKINKPASIMTLELVAISEALTYVLNCQNRSTVICTDSKSSLQHIARCASGHRGVSVAYDILSKIDELIQKGVQLRLQWVPSHIGIQGNEKADMLAKHAAKHGREINIILDYSERLPKFKIICHENWKEHFDRMSVEKGIWYKTIQSQPPRFPWFTSSHLSRKLVVTAHRIRSGHIPCNKFAFLMKKITSPNCEVCGVIEDLHHLLMECVRFESDRSTLFRALKLNKNDIGTFHKILSQPASDDARKLFSFMALIN